MKLINFEGVKFCGPDEFKTSGICEGIIMKKWKLLVILVCISMLTACQKGNNEATKAKTAYGVQEAFPKEMIPELENLVENVQNISLSKEKKDISAPSREQVLAMREIVLEGMTAEQIERLTENIKVANLRMERAYLNDGIFDKLADKDSLCWNYFDNKGDIQVGWVYRGELKVRETCKSENLTVQEFYEKYGEPEIVYNRFDADNFIDLMKEMQEIVQNDMLKTDLQNLIDETALAKETHEMEHANNIYKILHDMDYYLLRYGIEDVGIYVKDRSTILKYYGVLTVYQQ